MHLFSFIILFNDQQFTWMLTEGSRTLWWSKYATNCYGWNHAICQHFSAGSIWKLRYSGMCTFQYINFFIEDRKCTLTLEMHILCFDTSVLITSLVICIEDMMHMFYTLVMWLTFMIIIIFYSKGLYLGHAHFFPKLNEETLLSNLIIWHLLCLYIPSFATLLQFYIFCMS